MAGVAKAYGPELNVTVEGYAEVMKQLDLLPEQLQEELIFDMNRLGPQVASAVNDAFPKTAPMTNWATKGRMKWSDDAGVKYGTMQKKGKTGDAWPILKIAVYSPPHVVADTALAGHSAQGEQFVSNLNAKGGRDRWAWPAMRKQQDKIVRGVVKAVARAEKWLAKELS